MAQKLFTGRGFKIMVSLWILVLGFFNSERLKSDPTSVNAELSDITKVSALVGSTAALPCNIRPPKGSDVLLTVKWYKYGVLLYSYDTRVEGTTAHWADTTTLGGRAFLFTAEPCRLVIRNVIPTDQALYHCVVYFKKSSTGLQKISLHVAGLKPGLPSANAELSDIIKMTTVAGSTVGLPCDIRPPKRSDELLLVCWYKNGHPIYSYDRRLNETAAHWADNTLGGRVSFFTVEPSMLVIRDVILTDQALYHCRVDFSISNTLNILISLQVIELPEYPMIFDNLGRELTGLIGPYIENSSLVLTCFVSGGNPGPILRWWRDNTLISTRYPVNNSSRLSMLALQIPKLSRNFEEAIYTCTAENTDLVSPRRTNVMIKLSLKPLFVEILPPELPLVAQQTTNIECRTAGARPPATITWWLGEVELTSEKEKTSDNLNETLSVLQWTPQKENNEQVLTCRVSHIMVHTSMETNITLDVQYVPVVVLQLGYNPNPEKVEEGHSVYFDCKVQANPPPYKVTWEFNGQPITYNKNTGIITGETYLVIERVSRTQTGVFTCSAFNVEGNGISNSFKLNVIYRPVCKMAKMSAVGVIRNKRTEITCEVDANPEPEKFQWVLTNSSGMFNLESEKFTFGSLKSTISFTTTETHYGVISCKAINRAGQQVEPCQYTLITGVKPGKLHNCLSNDITNDSVELRCAAGYDGGLQTIHTVEAWESNDLLRNVSSLSPVWKLHGIGSGKALKFVFYSRNARGRSESSFLRVTTLSRLPVLTEPNSTEENASWMIAVLIGFVTAIFIVILHLARKRYYHSAHTLGRAAA